MQMKRRWSLLVAGIGALVLVAGVVFISSARGQFWLIRWKIAKQVAASTGHLSGEHTLGAELSFLVQQNKYFLNELGAELVDENVDPGERRYIFLHTSDLFGVEKRMEILKQFLSEDEWLLTEGFLAWAGDDAWEQLSERNKQRLLEAAQQRVEKGFTSDPFGFEPKEELQQFIKEHSQRQDGE
jgi:hypothetical protein